MAGNERGVIVGCLQQYQKRWGFVRIASSRAAWPHALHALQGKQQQQQQREKSRRDQVWVFSLSVLCWSGNISRAWGTGLVVIGGGFVEMDDEFVFTMDTPVDRNLFFLSSYMRSIICCQDETVNGRQYYLRPVWRKRE